MSLFIIPSTNGLTPCDVCWSKTLEDRHRRCCVAGVSSGSSSVSTEAEAVGLNAFIDMGVSNSDRFRRPGPYF